MKMNEKEKNILDKLLYYSSKKIVVHLSLIGNVFYNGKIDNVDKKRIILLDKKLGAVYVPLDEIINVEPFVEREVKE